MKGNPARQDGWMSKAGQKLIFENDVAVCTISQEKYKLENDSVVIL
jgi:hypothetical protein